MYLHYLTTGRKRQPTAGFTIAELLVSLSIVVIVSTIVLARYSSFNSAILLKSQAFELALTIREAQLLAVSAQGSAGNFRSSFGVFLSSVGGAKQQYVLFRDADGDGFSEGDVVIEAGQLDDRFSVRGFTSEDNGGGVDVSDDGELSIVFTRPNFDASFYDGAGTALTDEVVYIELVAGESEGNTTSDLRTIRVTGAGQIDVQ